MQLLFAQFIKDCATALRGKGAVAVFGKALDAAAVTSIDGLTEQSLMSEVENALNALRGASVTSPLLAAFAVVYEATALRHAAGMPIALKGACAQAAASAVEGRTYHEVIREMRTIAHAAGIPVGELQLARDVDPAMKDQILVDFKKRHPNAVLVMTVHPDLLGGVRLFVGNTVVDMSWDAQLQTILRARN